MELSTYLTLARDARAESRSSGPQFLCTLRRVEDETAARAVVEGLRREHWDARHHCSAMRIRSDAVERSSDDGEPAGTAGRRCSRSSAATPGRGSATWSPS